MEYALQTAGGPIPQPSLPAYPPHSMSAIAHAFWPRFYRLLRALDFVITPLWAHVGIGNTVEVIVSGRRTGRPRRVLLGLLRVGAEKRYLGHPDLACEWTRNVDVSGIVELRHHDGPRHRFRAIRLLPGAERDAAIAATFRQHPFPGPVLYWITRRHVSAVGSFYRLEPVGDDDTA